MSENEISNKRAWLILLSLGSFTFMSTLDASIVNIALPTIAKDLQISLNEATWSVSVYLIMISALLIFFGRMGDLFGKIRIFRYGTIIFTIGSLIAGVNLGIYFLLFARTVQALGAAMTMSNSFGITTTIFPPNRRARAMSLVGIFVSLGSVTGPGLGGFILQFLPWSYIFWINVPIGIFAILLGAKIFPKTPRKALKISHMDILGTVLFFLTIVSFFLGIEVGQNIGFMTPVPIIMGIVAVILFLVFLKHERMIKHPMVRLAIFKNQLFTISLVAALLMFMTNFFANIIFPFYLQNYLQLTPGTAGLLLMVFPITMLIIGPIGGILGDKVNKEMITAFAIVLVVVAQFLYTRLNGESTFLQIGLITALNAAGAALFQSPNNALVMSNVDKQYLGVAGSMNALARNLGMVTGISFATVSLFSAMSHFLGKRTNTYLPSHPDSFLYGMHAAFWISFAIALLTLLIVSFRLFGNVHKPSSEQNQR